MAKITLVIGESGTGKSHSIKNLDPKETFIINVLNKDLPFRGSRKIYTEGKDGSGNHYASTNYQHIMAALNFISASRPDVKTVVIDDFQYLMVNELLTTSVTGFEKFNVLSKHLCELIEMIKKLRPNIDFFFLSHSQEDDNGKTKPKTVGKMIDNHVCLEGMFTIVLHTMRKGKEYKFLTQNDGMHMAKSPYSMFDSEYIDNDLLFVKQQMSDYYDYETDTQDVSL